MLGWYRRQPLHVQFVVEWLALAWVGSFWAAFIIGLVVG
jgi:hypothetical protein